MNDLARPPLVPGALIGGKYRLRRRLGTGSMGVVWAAQNETTLSEVAVKLLSAGQPELRQRLLREARSCGQLKHRNIIDVYDVAMTEDGEPFLVMQLLQGETLAQRLKRLRRLDAAEAALIARDIARALTVAHAKHIIHRDLKPANIFLQEDEAAGFVVKVLDFGVSKNLATTDGLHTVPGAPIGSIPYMSPEQARADPRVDHRADLWSLGVVLFEMLAGARPFKGGMTELILAVTRGPIPNLMQVVRGLDEGLVRIVDRCLDRNLDARIATAVELVRLLEPHAAPAERPAASEARSSSDSAVHPARSGLSAGAWTGHAAAPDPRASFNPGPAPVISQPALPEVSDESTTLRRSGAGRPRSAPIAGRIEESTTVPRPPGVVRRNSPWPGQAAVDGGDAVVRRNSPWPGQAAVDGGNVEATMLLQPDMMAPVKLPSSPEISSSAHGLSGTVRISPAEAAQIAAANRPGPPPAPPPPPAPAAMLPDALVTMPLQRAPATLSKPLEVLRTLPSQPRPGAPAPPSPDPQAPALSPDAAPRHSPILRVFFVSAVVSIVLSIVAYAIVARSRETPPPPVGTHQGG